MSEASSFQGLHLDNAVVEMIDGDSNTMLPVGADYIAEAKGKREITLILIWPFMKISAQTIDVPVVVEKSIKNVVGVISKNKAIL